MGDKTTRPAKSAALLRAKFLKDALQRRTPPLSQSADPAATGSAPTLASDSLEVQRAYLEQLVECAPEAISILDEQYRIMRVNGEFTRMFGFLAEEALGRRIDSLIVPPDRNSETRWIGEVLNQGQKVTMENKRKRKDGTQE